MKRLLIEELKRAALMLEKADRLEGEKVSEYDWEYKAAEREAKQVLKMIRKHSVQWEKTTRWDYKGEE